MSLPYFIPTNNCQTGLSLPTNTQSHQMIPLINGNSTHSSQVEQSISSISPIELTLPSTDQQQQDTTVVSSLKVFHSPLNACQTVNTTKRSERKSNSTVATHQIEGWIIRESLKPFQQKENKPSLIKHKQQVFSNKSNVHQWNIDDVCLFFERVIGKNCYTSIIKEHLIDGTALLLLKDEHLINTFQMPLRSRLKLRQRITKLKHGDFSEL